MKKELIIELFEKFEATCYLYKGVECWSARELQTILGYTKWSNFQKVIEKAKKHNIPPLIFNKEELTNGFVERKFA